MGGEPWIYFVPYREDINGALRVLREQEFCAGRYRQSILFRNRGLDSSNIDQDYSNSKKSAEELIAEYGSVEGAIEAIFAQSEPDGTASILDIFQVSEVPEYCAVCPLSTKELLKFFGTDKPTYNLVKKNEQFWEFIERGQGIYIIIYKNAKPVEICFAGYSFD